MVLPNLQSLNYKIIHDDEIAYSESAATQIGGSFEIPITVPATQTNFALNLATLFPGITTAIALTIQENMSSCGFNVATSITDPGIQVRPNSIFSCGLASMQTLYIDNASATTALLLLVVLSGQ